MQAKNLSVQKEKVVLHRQSDNDRALMQQREAPLFVTL
jgi:hypothetical protein